MDTTYSQNSSNLVDHTPMQELMVRLLRGQTTHVSRLEETIGIPVLNTGLIFAVLDIYDYGFVYTKDELIGKYPFNAVFYVMNMLFVDVLEEKMVYGLAISDEHYPVVFMRAEFGFEALRDLYHEAAALLRKHFGIRFRGFFSPLCNDIGEISKHYSAILKDVENSRLIGISEADLHFSAKFATGTSKNFIDYEKQYSNAFIARKFDRALGVLHEIRTEFFITPAEVPHLTKLRFYGLLNTSIHVVEEARQFMDQVLFNEMNPTQTLLNVTTVDELYRAMDGIIAELDRQNKMEIAEKGVIRSVKNQIDRMFADPSLNVSELADTYDIPMPKLSKQFKQEYGCGVLEYIHRRRIDCAKRLILDGTSIKDTARISGFYDPMSLIRVFKKIEGTTPGKYANG